MESWQPGPKLKELYVNVLCAMYGASEDDTAALVSLVAEAKKPGWWHSFADTLPPRSNMFLGLEEAAKRLTTFQLTLVPGLLQTPAYRRAVIWIEYPTRPTEDVEKLIEVHSRRQKRLHQTTDPVELRVLLDESVLHTQMGGPAVIADQVRHLAQVGELSNVSVRIIPKQVGGHAGLLTNSFVLMEFPVHPTSRLTEPPVVFMQGFTGSLYLDQPTEIVQYQSALAQIQRVALDESRSRDLMLATAREYDA